MSELGIELTRPLLLQVSRFDPWKDPLGVVDVWKAVRETFPTLQLALIGAMAPDDPEGWRVHGEIEERVRGERDCFLLSNQMGVTSHEVNAFQRVADVVIQKSIREGFGLIVSETLWKGTAIVAGRAGGIPLQLDDGVSGLLATGTEEFTAGVCGLLEDPVTSQRMGAAGAERVREQFLLPRLLLDELELLRSVTDSDCRDGPAASATAETARRPQATAVDYMQTHSGAGPCAMPSPWRSRVHGNGEVRATTPISGWARWLTASEWPPDESFRWGP